jgi:hypothetical protein
MYYEGISWIFSQPGTVRALANGLKPGPGQEATRESIRMIFRAALAGELPAPQPEQPQPQAVAIPPQAMGRTQPQAPPAQSQPKRDLDQPLQRSIGQF